MYNVHPNRKIGVNDCYNRPAMMTCIMLIKKIIKLSQNVKQSNVTISNPITISCLSKMTMIQM